MISISINQLKTILLQIMSNMNAPIDIANKVVNVLLVNEYCGYSSHGIMRIIQYNEEAKLGVLNVGAKPIINSHLPQIIQIEGNRAFGILVIESIIENIQSKAQSTPIIALQVRNAHHLGRLNTLGMQLAKPPYNLFIIGFCNYLGQGARVALPGDENQARLCTNPMLLAFPLANSAPFVLDMSTSIVAEGKVANARIRGELLPEGVLVTSNQESTTDPNTLYSQPPTATLASLGFPLASHKGYGMAVFAETIVGVLGGAHSVVNRGEAGNGLFLLALNPTFFNSEQSYCEIAADIVKFCYQQEKPGHTYRYPGLQSQIEIDAILDQELVIPELTYKTLLNIRK